jgi:hypothetical protein
VQHEFHLWLGYSRLPTLVSLAENLTLFRYFLIPKFFILSLTICAVKDVFPLRLYVKQNLHLIHMDGNMNYAACCKHKKTSWLESASELTD